MPYGPPQEARMPQRRGSRWQDFLGLALATAADAAGARAGRQGQAVAGIRGQIAGREDRDRERSEREVLRQYRNRNRQFAFEQEGVRRRIARQEKTEERAYRRGEKQDEREWLLKQLQGGASGDITPEQTVQNRLNFRQQLEGTSIEDLTTSGSQALIDALNNAKGYGISRDTAIGELKEAIANKRAAAQRAEKARPGIWAERDRRRIIFGR